MPKMIRSASLTDYVEVARSVGLDPYRMLEKVGLPRSCLRKPDLRISVEAVEKLLEASAKASSTADFGLRLAKRRELSNLGPLALIVREQPTTRKAVEALIQYIGLHSDALSPRLDENDGFVTISRILTATGQSPTPQAVELSIGALYRILKSFIGERWRPEAVCFMHSAPQSTAAHQRFFGTRVRFGWEFDGIVCKASDLETPIPTANPVMAGYLKQYFDSVTPRGDPKMSATVRELTWVMLRSGNCSAAQIAAHLGINRRTLTRRLSREGQSFTSILDEVRTEMAKRYLQNLERPLYGTADLLGFSSLSAFSRWFSNRFGCNPSAWRIANA
jgi:AraC-like DNA-binding protein